MMKNLTDLSKRWIKFIETESEGNVVESSTIDEVMELSWKDPSRSKAFIQTVLSMTNSSNVIAKLGVGPLEDLVFRNPSMVLEWLNEDSNSSKLRTCLSYVDIDPNEPAEVKIETWLKEAKENGSESN